MKDETFDYIWNEIIAKEIYSLDDIFSEAEKKEYHFKYKNLKKLKKLIFLSYNAIKTNLKSNYYDTSRSNNNPRNRIDNHKIAACLCYSVMQNRVFTFEVSDNMPERMFTINYELAYTVSLRFLFYTLISRYNMLGRSDLASRLQEQSTLVVPATSAGHDEYHTGRIHTLALNDLYGNTFDILTYSDMMFWIEYYNRQIIENVLNPLPLMIE